jgi:hypothetical protein
MNVSEAIAIVSRLTYKPGWSLQAYPEPHTGGLILRFGKDEPDSEKGGDAVRPLMYTTQIPKQRLDDFSRDLFLRTVFATVTARELHEVEEWLRLDGEPLFEPHPETGHRGVLGDGTSLVPVLRHFLK